MAVARDLGIADQTLHNWVKAQAAGRLGEASAKPFKGEHVEITRLNAELARFKIELDRLKKAAAYFAKELL